MPTGRLLTSERGAYGRHTVAARCGAVVRRVRRPEDGHGGAARRGERDDAGRVLTTILLTDIVDSTGAIARLGDRRWRDVLAAHYADCGARVERFGGTFVDTTGDGILATFERPSDAVRAAVAIQSAAHARGLAVRAGVHTGRCERLGAGIVGMAVHIAARACALGGPDEVMTTSAVHDLALGSPLGFESRGSRTLKGVPGTWSMFCVTAP